MDGSFGTFGRGRSQEVARRKTGALGPGLESDITHQIRREIARHAAWIVAPMPETSKQETELHLGPSSGDVFQRAAQLRREVVARPVHKARARLPDDQRRNGAHLERTGV